MIFSEKELKFKKKIRTRGSDGGGRWGAHTLTCVVETSVRERAGVADARNRPAVHVCWRGRRCWAMEYAKMARMWAKEKGSMQANSGVWTRSR